MSAAGATILAFPPRLRLLPPGDLELRPEQLVRGSVGAPATAADRDAWHLNLLLAAPLFLSPQAGTAWDVAVVAAAILVFTLMGRAASRAPALLAARRRGEPVRLEHRGEAAALAAALLGAILLVPALLPALALFALLEAVRHGPGGRPGLPALLMAVSVVVRVDAGAAVLGLNLPAALTGAAFLLGLVIALTASSPARPAGGLWRELGLLALTLGTVGLYAAALSEDPWVARAAGAWALLSVPLVLLGLLRLWALGGRPAQGRLPCDPWLLALGTAWAVLLTLTLRPAGL